MDKVLKELQEFRREIKKIKEFCVLVAVEHKHIPGINRAWHDDAEDLIYQNNKSWKNDSIDTVMKTLIHLIYRIEYLEENNGEYRHHLLRDKIEK
jgi:RNase P/RNase MRP subunit p30